MHFPKDFVWGAATASYQIEGAAHEDGRGLSIWDTFSRIPGKVANGDTGDVACDHYHRYLDDVALMADLGLHSYRFSIAWPRIFPTGSGAVNPKGIDFYKRLVDALLSRGIKPVATLYHWDLPQGLQDLGGWGNRETAYRFQEYAATMFRELGDVVDAWTTINEPFCVAFVSHASGEHAPGYQDWPLAVRVSHHVLLAHGLGLQAFRQLMPKEKQIGITLNMTVGVPATDTLEDREAAHRFDGYANRWFADPIFRGSYPEDILVHYRGMAPIDFIANGDMQLISQPIDFLGLNYYTRAVCQADPSSPFFGIRTLPPTAPVTDQNWEIVPDCLRQLLIRIEQDWTRGLPLYIHENGCAMPDVLGPDGRVHDTGRLQYLRDHFAAAHAAIQAGVNLKGFYVWSLLDNFEWAWGYEKRFGIVYVDYPTQRRILKDSALWYRDVIRQNGWSDGEQAT
ncbi:MAG: GH1 family beta-glucosidase [Bacillota bacterium]